MKYLTTFLLILHLAINLKSQTEIVVQNELKEKIISLTFSPDGKNFIVGLENGTCKLYQTSTMKEIRAFTPSFEYIKEDIKYQGPYVLFTPDGKNILIALTNNIIGLWDVNNGKLIRTFESNKYQNSNYGHEYQIASIGVSSDGKSLIAGTTYDRKTIYVWDINTGNKMKPIRLPAEYDFSLKTFSFSPDGKYSLVNFMWETRLFDIVKKKEIKKYDFSNCKGEFIFTPDGNYAVSISGQMMDIKAGNIIRTFNAISNVAFTSDSKYMLTTDIGTGKMRLYNLITGEEIKISLEGDDRYILSAISPDGKFIIATSREHLKDEKSGYVIKLWDVSNDNKIGQIKMHSSYSIKDIVYTPDGFCIAYENEIKKIDLKVAKLTNTFAAPSGRVNSITPDGKYAFISNTSRDYWLYEISSGKKINTLIGSNPPIAFSPDGKTYLDNILQLVDIKSGKILIDIAGEGGKQTINTMDVNSLCFFRAAFSPNGQFIFFKKKYLTEKDYPNSFIVSELKTGRIVNVFKTPNYKSESIKCFAFTPDGKYIISAHCPAQNYPFGNTPKPLDAVLLWDINTGIAINKNFPGDIRSVNSFVFSPDGNYILSGQANNVTILWEFSTGNIVKRFSGQNGAFTKDGRYVILTDNGSVCYWNLKTDEWVKFIIGTGNNKWVTFTNDGYWDASNDGGDMVAMVEGLECWNIDQFTPRYNRPDIILQRLGSTNLALINHYNQQYKKRLRKLGLTEDKLSLENHVPISEILKTYIDGKFISLDLKLSDNKYLIKSYNIFINDVPIFGGTGKPVSNRLLEFSEKVELGYGDNKIEVSCFNEQGVESYRASTLASYNKQVVSNLYFLAFGVSNYNDKSLNLQYAHKDALDIEKVAQNFKGNGFNDVYTKVLINEQVTPEAIKAAKEFVKNAKIDDTFILFIAGHGKHDDEGTYFFLTYNADLKNLKETAAKFESIEDLLQGIPPRSKLFLMDACESGEVDIEEQELLIASAIGEGISSRGFKKNVSYSKVEEQGVTRVTNLYQKDSYIYNDLVRRSGAIVFSSSKGSELSYERSDIKNGLFSNSIIKALTTANADNDEDEILSTDELRSYVSTEVAEASGNMQHPTVDRDNIYQKFGFKLPKQVVITSVTDVEGNTYKVVKIGKQLWMAENLKTTKYNDGTTIPLLTGKESLDIGAPGYYWYKNDEISYKNTYGALYNWYTVNTGKLCPAGWHVPTDNEWGILTKLVKTSIKLRTKTGWNDNNVGIGTDEFGFSALPGGMAGISSYRYFYYGLGYDGSWWSTNEKDPNNAFRLGISRYFEFDISADFKTAGLSVRCLKD